MRTHLDLSEIIEENLLNSLMAQISVTISDETDKLLTEIAQATGLTKSSLAAEILRRGLYEEAEKQAKVANFRQQQKTDTQKRK